MLLAHARGASKGVGEPIYNQNNHPFTSSDRSLALIHNGRVDDCEYTALKQKYAVKSNCDSEILLRIIENTKEADEISNRLNGIKSVYSLINEGHMAVAVGERLGDGTRLLWLFRNEHRPLWIADLRENLGQIFFFSEPSIWEDAVASSGSYKVFLKSQKLIELPNNQIWHFSINPECPNPQSVHRYEIHKTNFSSWNYDGQRFEIEKKEANFKIVTELNDDDHFIAAKKSPKPFKESDELRTDFCDRKCDEIIDVVNNIRQYAEQLAQERSITKQEFEELLAELEQKRKELEALSSIINR